MSRLRMTKSALAQRRREIASYQRALPSLELKRQQLLVDLLAERVAAQRQREAMDRLMDRARAVRFASDRDVALPKKLHIAAVARSTQTRLGTDLPVIGEIAWDEAGTEAESRLPWIDAAVAIARGLAETDLRLEVAEDRVGRLQLALRKTIQRINLLQQLLIPTARKDIARITNFLADGQRMSMARTKLLVAQRGHGGRRG